ncbi:hypothetical protein AL710_06830 [Clostridium botulinum]|nr:AAA family ATPase [Clostridium botulinum]OPD23106.1 hypothetical protein AL710_06830 [Clostridium botulinum]
MLYLRFGKSLFISMFEKYYDINKKDKFEELFGDLYIGKEPTEEKNSFLVWKISFAGVDAGHGEEEVRESFNFKVSSAAREFLYKYGDLLGENKLPMEDMSVEMVVAHINMLSKIKIRKYLS